MGSENRTELWMMQLSVRNRHGNPVFVFISIKFDIENCIRKVDHRNRFRREKHKSQNVTFQSKKKKRSAHP